MCLLDDDLTDLRLGEDFTKTHLEGISTTDDRYGTELREERGCKRVRTGEVRTSNKRSDREKGR